MSIKLRFVLLASALCAAGPALAQDDLSVSDLLRLFEQQKQVFSEAENNGLGQTRGLKLVTLDDVTVEPASDAVTVATEAPAGETTTQGTTAVASATEPTDPNAPIKVALDPDEPMVFGQLDPELQVNLHIKFDFDSAALSDAEKPKLSKMCEVLRQSSLHLVRIVGHTDSSGSEEYNDTLSVLRAKEVARHLTEDCGIDPARLETVGMGERFPSDSTNPRADENRRVEFQALS